MTIYVDEQVEIKEETEGTKEIKNKKEESEMKIKKAGSGDFVVSLVVVAEQDVGPRRNRTIAANSKAERLV